jgi:hypothetical protein
MLTGGRPPIDLATNVESLGARVMRIMTIEKAGPAIATVIGGSPTPFGGSQS